jgi:hypothetical protein
MSILATAAFVLTGCGGGGGGSSSNGSSADMYCYDDNSGDVPISDCGTLYLSGGARTLPLNPSGIPPNLHGVTQTEVTIHWQDGFANPIAFKPVTLTMSPDTVTKLSVADDPTTPADESALLYSSITLTTDAGGSAVAFVNSEQTPGTSTLRLAGSLAGGDLSYSNEYRFTVSGTAGAMAKSLQLTSAASTGASVGIYVRGSPGRTTAPIVAALTDDNQHPVADPVVGNSGHDNVLFEILGDADGGTLSASSAAGPVSGVRIATTTQGGTANVTFHSGSRMGPIQIRATADRADNDVDNGIANPLAATTTIVVSDGQLFKLALSPDPDAIRANRVAAGVSGEVSHASSTSIADTQASYTLVARVLATDREGNPVLPGTAIQFGVVDSPVSGFPAQGPGIFSLYGNDGDAQANGVLFTASGRSTFMTAEGGVKPGDTLLMMHNAGNAGPEGARTVRNINGAYSLFVTTPFDANDATGVPVDAGSTLLFAMGRMEHARVVATTPTDDTGVATATIDYPAAYLGQTIAIWAQGAGVIEGKEAHPAAVEQLVFPGIAPARLVVGPTPLIANTAAPLTVCIYDDAGSPIKGVQVPFSFHDLGIGTGSIEGVAASGALPPTDTSGCSRVELTTAAVSDGSPDAGVQFRLGDSAINAPIDLPIRSGPGNVLQASRSSLDAIDGNVVLTLLDSKGQPIGGVAVSAICAAAAEVVRQPGTTDQAGHAAALIDASAMNRWSKADSDICTFATPVAGGPTVSIEVSGENSCLLHATSAQCVTQGH